MDKIGHQIVSKVEIDKKTKDFIELDTDQIESSTKEGVAYDDAKGVKIKLFSKEGEDKGEKQKYLAELSGRQFSYVGVLDENFGRSTLGKNTYTNQDRYLGNWVNNVKDGNGIYIHRPSTIENLEDTKLIEIYNGMWKHGQREEKGLYIWHFEKEGETVDNAKFDAFVGIMENDTYKYGYYISRDEGKDFYYHGNFDEEGNKFDDNAYYCQINSDGVEQHFLGQITKNKITKGLVAIRKNEDYIDFLHISNNNTDDLISETASEEEKNLILKKIDEYVALAPEDFFNKIYKLAKTFRDYVEKVKSIDNYDNDSEDNLYPGIFGKVAEYVSICKKVIPAGFSRPHSKVIESDTLNTTATSNTTKP